MDISNARFASPEMGVGAGAGSNVVTTDRFQQLQSELDARTRQQTAVAELGQAALTRVDVSLLIGQACALAADTLAVDICRMLEWLPDRQRLGTRTIIGYPHHESESEVDSEAIFTFESSEPVVFDRLSEETRFSGEPILGPAGVVSGMSVVLPGRTGPLGILGAYSRSERHFKSYEIEFMKSIANVLAAAIENKRTQIELAESRARIERRAQPGRIGSWAWSRGNRVWQWSDAIFRILDADPQQTLTDYGAFLAHVHTEDRNAFVRMIERAFVEPGEWLLDHRVLTESGRVLEVRSSVRGVFGAGATPLQIIGTIHENPESDPDERERAGLEALVELSAAEWRMVCDTLEAMVVVIDTNTTILRLNELARRALGISFEEATGSQLPSASHGEPWSTMRQLAAVITETHLGTSAVCRDPLRGTSWQIAARTFGSHFVSDERIVLIARDITDEEQREQVRREADVLDAVTQLIRGLSRESAEPMNLIGDLLSKRLQTVELSPSEVRQARSAVHSMSTLFRELEEYARPFELDPGAGEIRMVVEGAMRELAGAARIRDIDLRLRIVRGNPAVMMNRLRLHRLFKHILEMFIERTNEGARVDIVIAPVEWRKEEWTSVTVSTNALIFTDRELRWSLDPNLLHLDGRSGLGFSIDQRIIDEHGASMTVMNRKTDEVSYVEMKFRPFGPRGLVR
ncbi:MAG: PAS domain-containing protein [Thermoanaerobaculia bacterium]